MSPVNGQLRDDDMSGRSDCEIRTVQVGGGNYMLMVSSVVLLGHGE